MDRGSNIFGGEAERISNSTKNAECLKTKQILFKGFHVKRKSPHGNLKQDIYSKHPVLCMDRGSNVFGGEACPPTGWHYLSNPIRPPLFSTASLVLHGCLNLPHYSPLLKKTCVRQVALDKWLPLTKTNKDEP